jgi:hypothetical protein
MDDERFLARVIELYQAIYVNEMAFLIGLDNRILFAGNKIENLTGLSPLELIGKNHLQSLPLPEENIEGIIASLDKVIHTRVSQKYLSINLNHPPDYLILDCTEKPIINPTTDQIVALSIESRKLDFAISYHKLLMLTIANQSKGLLSNAKHVDSLLTLRQHEITFLLFHCKSAEKVAQILASIYAKSIAPKTIHNIMRQQIYPKFGVYSQKALLDKAYHLSYHKNVPVTLLSNLHIELSSI